MAPQKVNNTDINIFTHTKSKCKLILIYLCITLVSPASDAANMLIYPEAEKENPFAKHLFLFFICLCFSCSPQ